MAGMERNGGTNSVAFSSGEKDSIDSRIWVGMLAP